jgi:hypothetical protein
MEVLGPHEKFLSQNAERPRPRTAQRALRQPLKNNFQRAKEKFQLAFRPKLLTRTGCTAVLRTGPGDSVFQPSC